MSKKPKIWIVAGATASGKTSLGIQMAQEFNSEVINFDSRQVYRELNIGVARPSENELSTVPHHLIGTQSIHQSLNAQSFAELALEKVTEVVERSQTAILVGGTGLYLKALLYGFDDLPETSSVTREQMENRFRSSGLLGLWEDIQTMDPEAIQQVDSNNTARVKRTWEILTQSGKTLHDLYEGKQHIFPFNYEVLCIDMPREMLYERINLRVDAMITDGFLDEANELHSFKGLNPLRTLGYKELFEHIEGVRDWAFTIELIKQKTRNYAKRQLTWFRNQENCVWDSQENLIRYIRNSKQ